MARLAGAVLVAALVALAGCSRNPVLGDWELDRSETPQGAVLAVQAAGLETISFDREGAHSGDTEIPGEWIVTEDRVRLVREDGGGEHSIEVISNDLIRVELPIGVTAYYRRK